VVRAVDATTGALKWSYNYADYMDRPQTDAAGNIFRAGSNQLRRLDPATGAALWTVSVPNLWIQSIASDGIYVTGPSYATKVRKSDGVKLWQIGDPTITNSFKTLAVFPGGTAVHYAISSTQAATVTAIDSTTGAQRYTKTHPGVSFPAGDKQGRVYLVNVDGTLSQLNSAGDKAWTYTAPYFTGYGQARVGDVLDSDSNGVYVRYSTFGYMTSPMGLAALVPATGAARWTKFDALNMYYVGSDATYLYMEEASRGGPVKGLAYVK
jgi:outer membrane protein assembly factor BamB